ncbi:hypothetical protein KBI23_23075 [bacterium]|nr:hypothetical protein [bacterium]MBP9809876.1 hypothetical protein [bacterium]
MSDPNNVSANYYAGYCFYLAGRRSEAVSSFWRLAQVFPTRREGIQALAYLRQIDPDFAKHNASKSLPGGVNQVPGRLSRASAGEQSTQSQSNNEKLVPKLSAKDIVERLVEVKPSAGKNPNVSPSFIRLVKDLVVAMPLPVLRLLLDQGARIVVVSSAVEHDMRIQNTAPRGWDSSFSWKESPALTQGSKVVMSQFRADSRSGEAVSTTEEIGVLRHETGHAVDYCLGQFSDSPEFKHAYALEAARVPDEHKQRLDYFLQKSSTGPSETFAELFCYSTGGETDAGRKESGELVHKYFPQCELLMTKRLAALGQ